MSKEVLVARLKCPLKVKSLTKHANKINNFYDRPLNVGIMHFKKLSTFVWILNHVMAHNLISVQH